MTFQDMADQFRTLESDAQGDGKIVYDGGCKTKICHST